MSRQNQNLLWLMIVCCALCQITCSEKLIIEVDSTDQCFWDRSSSHPAITQTCLTYDDMENCHIMNVTLKISSQGQCRSYSFSAKLGGNHEIRMNETVKGIKLWLLQHGSNCLLSVLDSSEIDACLAQGDIMSISIIPQTVCQNIDPVDPRETCRHAVYDSSACKGDEGNKYILSFKDNNWKCVTCENRPTFNLTTDLKDEHGFIDPSKASDALNDLKCDMEKNISKAAIVTGDVVGLLHVQAKNTETKDICYSSDEDMINDVDCQSDLKTEGFPWSVKIPSEAFNKSRMKNNGCAFVGILLFKNMGNRDETQILNNEVYGITMGANISNLTDKIDMFFTQSNLVGKASCVSWDGKGELDWTTYSCETEKIDSNTIKCSCSHLMFFAVLMSLPDENVTPCPKSLTVITYIGCGIFMFFLSIALFMHFLLRKAKSNQATKILMNMFVALCLLNVSFLSSESVAKTEDNAACVFIALVLHYSMLASFTWFFIQALHMYLWLIRQNISITNYMRKITVLGWVCPVLTVVVIVSVGGYKAVILNVMSGTIAQICWITNPYIHYTVNIGYYALVFIFMAGIFITVVTRIVRTRNIRAIDGKRKTFRKQLMMVLSLFLLFGLTWSVAFFSYGPMCFPLYYIFTVLNSLLGFFLFLYYYHIHNDVAGNFSDDPESTDSTTTIAQFSIIAVENIHN